MKSLRIELGLGAMALFMSAAPAALAQTAPTASGDQPIIVTATRTATNIQKTDVQVSAFNTVKLRELSVQSTNDITYLAPSVRFSSNSGAATTYIALRGISIPPVPVVPTAGQGTQVYFEEVPLAGSSLNLPTYDISDLEVLQGPQGTLFGRNTLAGAILLEPTPVGFTQNGYFKAGYGNYNAWTLEGAGNATILPDVLAVRVAGQIQRHDGYIKSLSPVIGSQDNLATEAFRVSLLFTPTSKLRNVFTFDYFHENDTGNPTQSLNPTSGPFSIGNPTLAAFTSFVPPFTNDLLSQAIASGYPTVAAALAGQQALAACKHRCIYYGNIGQNFLFTKNDNYRIFNTTTFDVSPNLSFKNIFGYQLADLQFGENSGGTGLPLLLGQQYTPARSLTEEFQVRGSAWDGRVHGSVGVFYQHNDDDPGKPSGLVTSGPAPFAENSTSTAVYFNFKASLTDKLTFDGGFRYTWDSQSDCSLGFQAALPTVGQCYKLATATQDDGNPAHYGNGILKEKDSAPTWSVGLNYQATPDLFFYVVSRRGYRSGGVNSPYYNSPCVKGAASNYAAGQSAAAIPGGSGTCDDFGLAATGGVTASGKSVDLRPLQIQQPETLTDVEIGMRSDWTMGDWRGRVNLTYFHYWYNNVLSQINWGGFSTPWYGYPSLATTGGCVAVGNCEAIFAFDPAAPTFGAAANNVGNIVADGVQADIAVMPTKDLSVDLNLSYLRQKATVSVPSALVSQIPGGVVTPFVLNSIQQLTSPTSPWSFTITARYVLPWRPLDGDLVLNYDYFWTSSWHAQNVLLPGYDVHNIRLDWNNIGNSNVSVGLWARNLLDNAYASAMGSGPYEAVVYGDPRTFGADVTVKFH